MKNLKVIITKANQINSPILSSQIDKEKGFREQKQNDKGNNPALQIT